MILFGCLIIMIWLGRELRFSAFPPAKLAALGDDRPSTILPYPLDQHYCVLPVTLMVTAPLELLRTIAKASTTPNEVSDEEDVCQQSSFWRRFIT